MAAESSAGAAPERKLTKKEKKAQAFRASKGKGKASSAKDAAPSFEDEVAQIDKYEAGSADDDDEQEGEAGAKKHGKDPKKASKKRSRDDADARVDDDAAETEAADAEEQPKKKKRQRGKTQAQRDREARLAAADGAQGADGEDHHRLLLFVGNMPYQVTAEDIQKHFEPCGEVPTVRLLTPKAPSSAAAGGKPPASKGCAFLEFTTATGLQSALRLHHSSLSGRKINVELTAGGGGNSATRKAKIEAQRKRLTDEREKAAKNKRLKEGESENGDKTGRWKLAAEKSKGDASADGEGEAAASGGAAEGEPPKKKKNVRDRRLKNGVVSGSGGAQKDGGAQNKRFDARAARASSGANAIKLASGWGSRA